MDERFSWIAWTRENFVHIDGYYDIYYYNKVLDFESMDHLN